MSTASHWHLSLQYTLSLFHCSASLLSANAVHSGSSVNYSTSQEGRGTWWWWGLGAGFETIKPGSRPPALFTATVPAQLHCFLPVLCVSCPFRGNKCCCSSDKHEARASRSCAFVLSMKTLVGRKEGCANKQINNLLMKLQTGIIRVQSDAYQVACSMYYTVQRAQ